MERDARESADVCAALEKEYPWIPAEKPLFGQPGSDYDWGARDAQAAFAEYARLEETLSGLSKKLNKRVRGAGGAAVPGVLHVVNQAWAPPVQRMCACGVLWA